MQCLTDLGQHAHDQQRVAAECKKVILATDSLDAQHLRPDGREGHFLFALRGFEHVPIKRVIPRFGQCDTVQLAIRGQRQRVHTHECSRNHVVRQAELQMLAKAFGRQRGAALFAKVGNQPRHARAVLAQHHDVVTHTGNLGQTRLDFTQLQAQAAQFGLRVVTPEEFQIAVSPIAGQIASTVQPLTGHERAVDEALARQFRQIQVATRNPHAADVQFAGHALGNPLASGIEQVNPRIGQRPPDGQHCVDLAVGLELEAGAVDARFGDPVGLDDLHMLATQPTQLARAVGRPDVRTADHRAHERQVAPRLLRPDQQRVEDRRHEVGEIDTRLAQQAIQRRRVHQRVTRAEHERAAKTQCADQVGAEHIEGKPGHLQVIEGLVQRVQRLPCSAHRDQPTVLDHDTLGRSGGARGVDHVSQMAGRQTDRTRVRVVRRLLCPQPGIGQIKHL